MHSLIVPYNPLKVLIAVTDLSTPIGRLGANGRIVIEAAVITL
jgi:hypothetical protein